MAASVRDWICRNRMIGSASGAAVASMARASVREVPTWAVPVVLADRWAPMRQRADLVERAVEVDPGAAVLEAAAVHSRAGVSVAAVDAAASVEPERRVDA